MRILIRGGSIPAGAGVAKSYVDILREYAAARGIEVLNRSRGGENSFDAVSTFREDIEPFRPDFLILHFAIDDAFFRSIAPSSRKTSYGPFSGPEV